MDRKIVKLHGTSGAGKSTVARYLMDQATVVYPIGNAEGKIDGYECHTLASDFPLYVLGKYETACGGCDGFKADKQIELLHKYAEKGHVFYEGLLASEYYGKLGEASERYGANHVFAFLDTPIDLCIDRIKARRIAAGNLKVLNESNTRGRIRKIEMLQKKLSRQGRTVVLVSHLTAGASVYELFFA